MSEKDRIFINGKSEIVSYNIINSPTILGKYYPADNGFYTIKKDMISDIKEIEKIEVDFSGVMKSKTINPTAVLKLKNIEGEFYNGDSVSKILEFYFKCYSIMSKRYTAKDIRCRFYYKNSEINRTFEEFKELLLPILNTFTKWDNVILLEKEPEPARLSISNDIANFNMTGISTKSNSIITKLPYKDIEVFTIKEVFNSTNTEYAYQANDKFYIFPKLALLDLIRNCTTINLIDDSKITDQIYHTYTREVTNYINSYNKNDKETHSVLPLEKWLSIFEDILKELKDNPYNTGIIQFKNRAGSCIGVFTLENFLKKIEDFKIKDELLEVEDY